MKLFSKKTLLTGILVGAATITALMPSVAFADAEHVWDSQTNLKICGSTTVQPIINAAVGVTTTGGHSGVGPFQSSSYGAGAHVQVFAGGSGSGRTHLSSGNTQIAMSSTNPPVAGYKHNAIARDGITMVANTGVTGVSNLTNQQIKDIYMGNITNWSSVGGPNATIVVLGRSTDSGTRETLMQVLGMANDNAVTARYDSNATLAAAVGSTANSIGYVGVGFVKDLPGTAKALKCNGIAATQQTVTTEDYFIYRYLYILTIQDPPTSTYGAGLRDFLHTDAGQDIVENAGFVRYTPSQDVNNDSIVDISDVVKAGAAWNTVPGNAKWNNAADVNSDGIVDISDIVSIGKWWNLTYLSFNQQW